MSYDPNGVRYLARVVRPRDAVERAVMELGGTVLLVTDDPKEAERVSTLPRPRV